MDPNTLAPRAYYQAAPTRTNMGDGAGEPHYVGLTPEVSSVSGVTSVSASTSAFGASGARSVSGGYMGSRLASFRANSAALPMTPDAAAGAVHAPTVLHTAVAPNNQSVGLAASADLGEKSNEGSIKCDDERGVPLPSPPTIGPLSTALNESASGDSPRCAHPNKEGSDSPREHPHQGPTDASADAAHDDDAPSVVSSLAPSGHSDSSSSDEEDEDEDSQSSSSLNTPVIPTLSEALMRTADPVEVVRARIRALGTAILRITETALTDTGASLEDSLKLEHKVGPTKKKNKKKTKGGANRATPRRPNRGTGQAPFGRQRPGAREASSVRASAQKGRAASPSACVRGGTTKRAGSTAMTGTGTRAASSGATRGAATPARRAMRAASEAPLSTSVKKERPMSEPTAATPETSTLMEPTSGTPHCYDFYVPSPEVVTAYLKDAPALTRYETLLSRRKSQPPAAALFTTVSPKACGADDEHQGESEEEEGAMDRAPLYDASNAIAAGSFGAHPPPGTWADVRALAGVSLDTDREVSFLSACGVRHLSTATLAGRQDAAGASVCPAVLAAAPLSAEEHDAVKRQLAPALETQSPSEETEEPFLTDAEAAPLGERNHSFHVLYVHRYEGSGDSATSPSGACRNLDSSVSLSGTQWKAEPSAGGAEDSEFGKTYYRALFAGARRHVPAPSRTRVVRVELPVGPTNERVKAYAQRCVSGGSLSMHAHRPRSVSPHCDGNASGCHTRTVSEGSQTPAIEGRIRRLESWQMARHHARDADRRKRRRHSLFSRPARASGTAGTAGATFYYYAPAAGDAVPPSPAAGDGATSDDESVAPVSLTNGSFHVRAASMGRSVLTPPAGEGRSVVDVLLTSPVRPSAYPPSLSLCTNSTVNSEYPPSALTAPVAADKEPACQQETVRNSPQWAPPPLLGDTAQLHPEGDTDTTPSRFLEVVVADGYDTMEWMFSGAARRHSHSLRKASDASTGGASTHTAHEGRTESPVLTRSRQQTSSASQGAFDGSTTSNVLAVDRRPGRAAVVFVSIPSNRGSGSPQGTEDTAADTG